MVRTRTWGVIVLGLLVAIGLWWRTGGDRQLREIPEAAAPIATAAARSTNSFSLLSTPATVARTATARVSKGLRLRNTDKSLTNLTRLDTAVLLRNAFLDTAEAARPAIPESLRAQGGHGSYIVQAKGPITDDFRQRLREAGATVVSYVPNNAYLVRVPEAGARQLESSSQVQGVLPYEPYYKLEESLLALAVSNRPMATNTLLQVTLFPDQAGAGRASLEDAGAEVLAEDRSPFGPLVTVRPQPGSLTTLARLSSVQGIEIRDSRAKMSDLARVRVQAASNSTNENYLGLTGSNILVNINDSGVDAKHPALQGRVISVDPSVLQDTDGHGTHVAGILAGNGALSDTVTNAPGSDLGANFRGMAPGAKLFVLPVDLETGPLISDTFLQETAVKTNAFISNNSWGYPNKRIYDSSAANYDAAVRDALPTNSGSQPLLFVFAAGNFGYGNIDGSGGESDSITSPGTAKNVITVGALDQLRNITNLVEMSDGAGGTNTNAVFFAETDSDDQVSSYSSRGNVGAGTEGAYGRFKPDVVAPGAFVVSARSRDWKLDLHPTTEETGHFPGQYLVPGGMDNFVIVVPNDAQRVEIEVLPDMRSSNAIPDVMIYARLGYDVDATGGGYNVAHVNNLIFPRDHAVTPGEWHYSVANVSEYFVPYQVSTRIVRTNSYGTYFEVLQQLDDGLGPNYRFESGTSMAAPVVSGMLALMKEFFEQKAPTGLRHTNSPALMKALLINGARSLPRYDLQVARNINAQGWGLVNLTNSIPSFLTNSSQAGAPMQYFDQSVSNAVATGERKTWNLKVTPDAYEANLRLTLVWTDPPGNPNAGVKLVNDLDLVVTNLDTGEIYWGNDIGADSDFNTTRVDTDIEYNDVINNVENIFIPGPGTNYSITVRGNRVNVNAVTAHPDKTVQDYALVMSLSDQSLTNALTLSKPVNQAYRAETIEMTNSMPLLGQHVGANSPLIGGANGTTNQWRFYVFTNAMNTNIPPESEYAGSTNFGPNVAFITFLPPNLSVSRNLDADIDMYVSTSASLTNLDATAIANADKSRNRGGNELVVYTNAPLGQVYYIGIKSEDQQACEFGLIVISSDRPFDEEENGHRVLHGHPTNVRIPDGSPKKPGAGLMFAIGVQPMQVGRVVVSNIVAHENLGDLVGNLSHAGEFAVLNNHSLNGNTYSDEFKGTNLFIYDDSNSGDILYSRPTDGPGNFARYIGTPNYGTWMLTMVDDSLTQTGRVVSMDIRVDPDPGLTGLLGSVLANSFEYYYIDVPEEATNLIVRVWDIKPPLPLNLYIRRGDVPTLGQFDKSILIDPNLTTNILTSTNVLQLGQGDVPPLIPGRYYIGVYNPNAVTVSFRINATLEFDLSGNLAKAFTSPGAAARVGDDMRMFSTNYVNVDRQIVDVRVGVRIDHPRPSDLALHLTSPQGTRVLLMEDRGRTVSGGLGSTDTNGNIGYFTFTELTNVASGPIKFANPADYTKTVTKRLIDSDSFEAYPVNIYTQGQSFGAWRVTTNAVEVVGVGALANEGTNVVNVLNGGISQVMNTAAGKKYVATVSFRRGTATPGIVGWWPFDGSLQDMVDGNDGLPINGDSVYDTGKVGRALKFDGTSYVLVQSNLNLSGSSFTWQAWIDPADLATARPIFSFGSKYQQGVSLWATNNGALLANVVEQSGVSHLLDSGTNVLTANQWQHVALTYDRASRIARIYLNGVLVATPNIGTFAPQTRLNLYFGHSAGGDVQFTGAMDEVAWYNRALNQIEIQDIVNAGAAGLYATANPPDVVPIKGIFSVPGIFTNSLSARTNWQTSQITFTAITNGTPVVIQSVQGGFYVDSFVLEQVLNESFYLPEESLEFFKDQYALGNWVLEIEDTRVGSGGSTNATPRLISWQLQIIFATPAVHAVTLTNGIPYPNDYYGQDRDAGFIYGNQIRYFVVNTPRAARWATNAVLSTGNVIFSYRRDGLPTGDPLVDEVYLDNGNSASFVLSTNLPPLIHPGERYYLAVRNANPNETNNFQIGVWFDRVDPPNLISVPILTNGIPVTATISNGPALDYYQYTVSSGSAGVTFELTPKNGNVNLVARRWRAVADPLPNTTRYDYSSSSPGLVQEQIIITPNSYPIPLTAGIWYLGVVNLEDFPVTYTIKATETNKPPVRMIELTSGVPVDYLVNAGTVEDYFHLRVSDSNTTARFELYNLSGNADLVLRKSQLPSQYNYDAGNFGSNENKIILVSTNGVPTTPMVASNFTINPKLTLVGNRLTLGWSSDAGTEYVVQGMTNITSAMIWSDLSPVITATGTNTTFDIDLPTPYRIFRIAAKKVSSGDLVMADLNGDWYLAVLNHDTLPVTFTIKATVTPNFASATNYATVTNRISAGPGWKYFTFQVSTNATMAMFESVPLNGDVALYARKANPDLEFWPTLAKFDAASDQPGLSPEQIVLMTNSTPVPLTSGLWYFGVYNPSTNAVDFTFMAAEYYTPLPVFTALTNGVAQTNTLAFTNTVDYYWFSVSSNANQALFETFNADGDVDLYVRHGLPLPGPGSYQYASTNASTNGESMVVTTNSTPVALSPGLWFVAVSNADVKPVSYTIRASETLAVPDTNIVITINPKVVVTNGMVYLWWSSTVGATYQIQGRVNVADPGWNLVASNIVASGTVTVYGIPTTNPNRFFRIVQVGGGTVTPPVSTNLVINPRMTITNNSLAITWASVAGDTYRVEGRVNVTDTGWTTVSPDLVAMGATTTYLVPLTNPNHYFRVVRLGSGTVTPPVSTNLVINPRMTITNNSLAITWASVAGDTYRVDGRVNITDTNWNIVSPNLVATGTNTTYAVPLTNANHYFRVVLLGATTNQTAVNLNVTPSSGALTTNGFTLTWSAPANQKFKVEYSTNLKDWVSYPKEVASTDGTYSYVDTTATPTTGSSKYYRLILIP